MTANKKKQPNERTPPEKIAQEVKQKSEQTKAPKPAKPSALPSVPGKPEDQFWTDTSFVVGTVAAILVRNAYFPEQVYAVY